MRTTVITHPARAPGEAHFDEVTAIALLSLDLNLDSDLQVVRKEPTEKELYDPTIYVIDVGGMYDPALRNFDHHQDNSLDSSFVLIARYLDIEEKCKLFFPWWDSMNILDMKGPYELAKSLNSDTSTISKLQNPLADYLIASTTTWSGAVESDVVQLIKAYGRSLHNTLTTLEYGIDSLELRASIVNINGLDILYINEEISGQVLGMYKRIYNNFDISISRNARNNSLSAYRNEDVKNKVDFLKLSEHPLIKFVHKNGFLLVAEPEVAMGEFIGLVKQCILT